MTKRFAQSFRLDNGKHLGINLVKEKYIGE